MRPSTSPSLRRVALLLLVALGLAPWAAARPTGEDPRADPVAMPAGAAPDIAVEISPRTGEVNLVMELKVVVSGEEGADCSMLAAPTVDGARLQFAGGPNSRSETHIINGRWTRSLETYWDFVLIPERAGVIEVPPFRLQCRGVNVASEPLIVPVKATEVPDDAVRLMVVPSTLSLWQGQRFTVEVSALVDEEWSDRVIQGGMHLTLAWYDGLGGLMRLDDPPSTSRSGHIYLNGSRDPVGAQVGRLDLDDRLWKVFRLTVPLLAAESGLVKLPGSHFSVRLATEIRQQRDPFDLFGGRRAVASRVVEAKASAPPVEIDVRAPPLDGRPDSYTNAVGQFEWVAAAAPRSLKVGQTCTLSMRLSGQGNLEFVAWPDFTELEQDFRLFGKEEARDANSLRLAIEISPKNARVTEVPRLSFAVFDTEQEAYDVLTVGPFDLKVSGGGEEGLVDLLEEPDEVLNDLETIRETLPVGGNGSLPHWIWLLPGAVLLLGVEIGQRLRTWRESHPEQRARRGARLRLDRALRQASDVRDVAVAFAKFLSDRLGGPPAGLTVDEAGPRLPASDAGNHLRAELRKLVGRWEASYLGGVAYDPDEAATEARYLAELVEAAT